MSLPSLINIINVQVADAKFRNNSHYVFVRWTPVGWMLHGRIQV